MSAQTLAPEDDEVRAFLLLMRPFVLPSDADSYFPNVCDVLCRYFDHPLPRRRITYYRDLFRGTDFQRQTRISTNDLTLNSAELLNTWLNSFPYIETARSGRTRRKSPAVSSRWSRSSPRCLA